LFVKGIMKQLPVYINGDGEQTRDFTFVDNAVQMNIKGMLTDNPAALKQVYNVAIGENFSVNYLFNACREYLDSTFEATYREPRAGDIRNSLADISLAKNLLGYQPTKNFKDGLTETIDFFKKVYS
ncbi:MAG: GDP-mannose 4,6-dehydratase, partial [Ferruginibacter sp.]